MSITLQEASDNLQKDWDGVVMSSSHGTIFHTWKWLKILHKYSTGLFLPLMAYKGSQLIAIYPVFIQKKSFFSLAFSPPPRSYLLYLGPVIRDFDSLKQDKKESLLIELQAEVNKYLFFKTGCHYIRIRSSPGIYDSRYFSWTGFSVSPQYTYRINLSRGIEDIWSGFDRKLRVDINKAEREHVEVKEGGRDDLLVLSESLMQRFVEQGFKPNDYREYLLDLYAAFSPNHFKIFIAYYREKRIGGMVALCFKGIMYLWIGIPKSEIPGLSPNDLVQWEAIKWACRNGFSYYEVMDGGDNPRLRKYKAKYNPDLCIWYTAEQYSSALHNLIGIATKKI